MSAMPPARRDHADSMSGRRAGTHAGLAVLVAAWVSPWPAAQAQEPTETATFLADKAFADFDGEAAVVSSAGRAAAMHEELVTPGIDCRGRTGVTLTWHHGYRSRTTQLADVAVSTDGGQSFVLVFGDGVSAQFCPTICVATRNGDVHNEIVSVDLAAIADGRPDVRVSFLYYGTQGAGGDTVSEGWYWAVEDVVLASDNGELFRETFATPAALRDADCADASRWCVIDGGDEDDADPFSTWLWATATALPEGCEPSDTDCNENGVPDACELAGADCDGNGILDECDVAPVVVESPDVPAAVPPAGTSGTTEISLVVAQSSIIRDVDVLLDLNHTSDRDLTLTLVSPAGTEVRLVEAAGESGDDFTDTIFDDQAGQDIANGSPPFTGSFRPQERLSVLNGEDTLGTWTLRIVDDRIGGSGTVERWALRFPSPADRNDNRLPDECEFVDIVFDAVDVPIAVPADGSSGNTESEIVVAASFVIGEFEVLLDLTHTFDRDLTATLVSPAGTQVLLFQAVGGSGDNFADTVFDDGADDGIAEGTPPFTGSFRPQESLSALAGQNVRGTWTLRIVDDRAADSGTLNRWALRIPASQDCQSNGIPDDAEPDCNGDGVPDDCDPLTQDSGDCNGNGALDGCDIATEVSLDCNENGTPDECEIDENSTAGDGTYFCTANCDPDCNDNGVPDACELKDNDCDGNRVPDGCDIDADPTLDCDKSGVLDVCELNDHDCDGNGVLDTCDVADDPTVDCNANGILDECELEGHDCNGNGVLDACDIAVEASKDCNSNRLPDECEIDENSTAGDGPFFCTTDCDPDCDDNGVPDECDDDCDADGTPDACEIADGVSLDCNANGVPDLCDIAEETAADCNETDVPDKCELDGNDCNLDGIPDDCEEDCDDNGVPDDCDIESGASPDCDDNGVPDACDVASGAAADCDDNRVPDQCDIASGAARDVNQDGIPDDCISPADVDRDGDVDLADFLAFSRSFTGAGVPYGDDPDARRADVDADGDVDLADLVTLQALFTGAR